MSEKIESALGKSAGGNPDRNRTSEGLYSPTLSGGVGESLEAQEEYKAACIERGIDPNPTGTATIDDGSNKFYPSTYSPEQLAIKNEIKQRFEAEEGKIIEQVKAKTLAEFGNPPNVDLRYTGDGWEGKHGSQMTTRSDTARGAVLGVLEFIKKEGLQNS